MPAQGKYGDDGIFSFDSKMITHCVYGSIVRWSRECILLVARVCAGFDKKRIYFDFSAFALKGQALVPDLDSNLC